MQTNTGRCNYLPGLTLLLASWLSPQDFAKFLLHFGNHRSHGKILTKIIHYSKIVSYHDGQNSKITKNTIPSVHAAETQSEGSFHLTTTISTRFHNQNAPTCSKKFCMQNCAKNYDNVFRLPKF